MSHLWPNGQRIDVLVELGAALGLDPTELKVVLDVDTFGGAVDADGRPAHLAQCLGERNDVGRGDIERTWHIAECHEQHGRNSIAGMQELEPSIKTQHSRHDRQRQVASDLTIHFRPHEIG